MFDFSSPAFTQYIQKLTQLALEEDIGSGDCSASLIPATATLQAAIITREPMILAGSAFAEATFKQLDANVSLVWQAQDGDALKANDSLCMLSGKASALLTGERTALNFLQTLSATATVTHKLKKKIHDLPTQLLDTRKTIPGLRLAQKYAVFCGGGANHRIGLFDAILLKENHLACFASLADAISTAQKKFPTLKIEVEVENLHQLEMALAAGATHILLDNFTQAMMKDAVSLTNNRASLEASGSIDEHNIREIALTGVHAISVGALTKHVLAIDLSMRFLESPSK